MKILITGGAGFVGANLCFYFKKMGHDVIAFDNLARRGSENNLIDFKKNGITFIHGDIRNPEDFYHLKSDIILECSAQPSAIDGYNNPKYDITNNLYGVINALEYCRINGTAIILWSTNKTYCGSKINALPNTEMSTRYAWTDFSDIPGADPKYGISNDFSVDGGDHSIYGMTKIQADIACQEYCDAFNVTSIVNRFSCINGNEKILTSAGQKKFSQIKPNEIIYTNKGWARTSTGAIHTGKKEVFTVKTAGGYEIEATPDHEFYTPDGYKKLTDITYGSFVEIVPCTHSILDMENMPDDIILSKEDYRIELEKETFKPSFISKSIAEMEKKGFLDLKYNSPIIFDLVKLIGYSFGDAHISYKKRARWDNKKIQTKATLQIYDAEDENLLEIKSLIEKMGFYCSKIEKSKSRSELHDGKIIDGISKKIIVGRMPFVFLLKILGVPYGKKANTEYTLPQWIYKGPDQIKAAFLSGFLGAEGKCPGIVARNRHGKDQYEHGYFSLTQCKNDRYAENGKFFAEQIRDMFKSLGINSSFYNTSKYQNKKGEYCRGYEVRISQSADTYKKMLKIGFSFNTKRQKELLLINEFIKTKKPLNDYTSWKKIHTHNCSSKFGLWDQIIEKSPNGIKDVYDMTVPETSNFIASNFHVHNCLAGERQWGKCAQGWVAWFAIAALFDLPLEFIGWKGKQVRDILFIDDICHLIDMQINNFSKYRGEVFNIGGGPKNTLSLIEAVDLIEDLTGKRPPIAIKENPRKADHVIYISDIRKAQKLIGWDPLVDPKSGYTKIIKWIKDNRTILEELYL